jgi:hypothetical protein
MNLKLEMCKAVRNVFDSIPETKQVAIRRQVLSSRFHAINQEKRGGPPMKIWGPQQFPVVEAGKL